MTDTSIFDNPYLFYERLRANPEPWRVVHSQGRYQRDFILFCRYAEARAIFMQGDSVSKEIRTIRPAGTATPFDLHLLHRDGQDHLRLRRLVAGYFSRSTMSELVATVEEIVGGVLDKLSGREQVDLVADFAEPVPLLVMARVLGVPDTDLPQIRAWALMLADEFDSLRVTEHDPRQLEANAKAFLDYAGSLVAPERRTTAKGLMAGLISACDEGLISAAEAQGMVMFLLFAGHETTINLLGNGLWLLLTHPDQLALLQENPELIDKAVEEILRYESPEQRTSFRIATQSLRVGDYCLEPGQQFGVIIGAANRDEAEFPNADRFDIQRSPNRHLAFGGGLHDCLGKHLARLEARVALGMMINRYPRLQLLSDKPDWRRNSFFRGLKSLPARLGE